MPEDPSAGIPPEEVERRLRDLGQLYELGMALREVRLVDPTRADRVRERSASDEQQPSSGEMERRGS
jgi:hypothetical protein